jgi:hypothetical protein
MLPEIEQTIETISATLGNRLYFMNMAERPITLDKVGMLVAISCKDPQGFENAINELGPQMGLQPRDFLGNRLFTMDPQLVQQMEIPGGGPGVGIGGGFVFMGMANPVEQALRSSGQNALPTLAGENAYKRAVGCLDNDGVIAWGYADTATSFESTVVTQRLKNKQTLEQMREWDADMAADMEKNMTDPYEHWTDAEFAKLRGLLGPMAWQVRSGDLGFTAKIFQLRGDAAPEPN